ncbi:MAG: hypothetical protein ACR2PT_00345 [Endozoicomonas sp.]
MFDALDTPCRLALSLLTSLWLVEVHSAPLPQGIDPCHETAFAERTDQPPQIILTTDQPHHFDDRNGLHLIIPDPLCTPSSGATTAILTRSKSQGPDARIQTLPASDSPHIIVDSTGLDIAEGFQARSTEWFSESKGEWVHETRLQFREAGLSHELRITGLLHGYPDIIVGREFQPDFEMSAARTIVLKNQMSLLSHSTRPMRASDSGMNNITNGGETPSPGNGLSSAEVGIVSGVILLSVLTGEVFWVTGSLQLPERMSKFERGIFTGARVASYFLSAGLTLLQDATLYSAYYCYTCTWLPFRHLPFPWPQAQQASIAVSTSLSQQGDQNLYVTPEDN